MARILVVEDNPDNMKLFRVLIRKAGHEIIEMINGNGLEDTVERAAPDLILLDIQLPQRDGYALLKVLRDRWGTTRPVVALTAHAMVGDRERALEAGFDGYITKPIDVHRFQQQLAAALSRAPLDT